MTVQFHTRREDFPPNLNSLKIQQLLLYVIQPKDDITELKTTLAFKPSKGKAELSGECESVDSLISTRRGNGSAWISMTGEDVVGEWTITLPDN